MKVYVLVAEDTNGEIAFDMPVEFGRSVRAYASKARAKAIAKKFKATVIELDINKGVVV